MSTPDAMMEPVTSFNLVREPWIQCRMLDGTVTELSLNDVFLRSREIGEIVGELPTQTFAILRLVLAILYRALDEDFVGVQDWKRLWQQGIPVDDVHEYLAEFEDRFDLLHPTQPFFQVADLQTAKGEHKDVSQLILDLPANSRLFTMRSGVETQRLSFAEAARWVVNCQAFDYSGIKSGALGDTRVKGGKGYPLGVAWAGLLGGVFVEGATLHDTLLLNLVAPSVWEGDYTRDVPPWEKAQLGSAEGRPDRDPLGAVDLYTWQSRRIRLFWDDVGVNGSLLCNGDKLTPQNRNRFEMMTAWRRSLPQEKKLSKELVYMPQEHYPEHAFWRGISALMPRLARVTQGKEADPSQPPGVLSWLDALQQEDHLEKDLRIGLRAIGAVYGSQSSVVDEIIDDRLSVRLAVLVEGPALLAAFAEAAVQRADESVYALKNLSGDLAIAAGGSSDGHRARAEEIGFAALDQPYRRWLAGLSPDTNAAQAYDEWKETVGHIIREIADEMINAAGPQAWRGRMHSRGQREELVNTASAELRFQHSLQKTLKKTAEQETAA